jgi:hypothetical protein
MRIQSSAIAARPKERLPHFPAPQMSQIEGMVTHALMAAHEISLRNGAAFFVYFWVLVAGWVIVAIRAPLFGINIQHYCCRCCNERTIAVRCSLNDLQ